MWNFLASSNSTSGDKSSETATALANAHAEQGTAPASSISAPAMQSMSAPAMRVMRTPRQSSSLQSPDLQAALADIAPHITQSTAVGQAGTGKGLVKRATGAIKGALKGAVHGLLSNDDEHEDGSGLVHRATGAIKGALKGAVHGLLNNDDDHGGNLSDEQYFALQNELEMSTDPARRNELMHVLMGEGYRRHRMGEPLPRRPEGSRGGSGLGKRRREDGSGLVHRATGAIKGALKGAVHGLLDNGDDEHGGSAASGYMQKLCAVSKAQGGRPPPGIQLHKMHKYSLDLERKIKAWEGMLDDDDRDRLDKIAQTRKYRLGPPRRVPVQGRGLGGHKLSGATYHGGVANATQGRGLVKRATGALKGALKGAVHGLLNDDDHEEGSGLCRGGSAKSAYIAKLIAKKRNNRWASDTDFARYQFNGERIEDYDARRRLSRYAGDWEESDSDNEDGPGDGDAPEREGYAVEVAPAEPPAYFSDKMKAVYKRLGPDQRLSMFKRMEARRAGDYAGSSLLQGGNMPEDECDDEEVSMEGAGLVHRATGAIKGALKGAVSGLLDGSGGGRKLSGATYHGVAGKGLVKRATGAIKGALKGAVHGLLSNDDDHEDGSGLVHRATGAIKGALKGAVSGLLDGSGSGRRLSGATYHGGRLTPPENDDDEGGDLPDPVDVVLQAEDDRKERKRVRRAMRALEGAGLLLAPTPLRGGLLSTQGLSDRDFVQDLPQDNVFTQAAPGLSDFNNRRFGAPDWGYTPDVRKAYNPVSFPTKYDGSSNRGLAADGGDGNSHPNPFSDVTASDERHGFDYVGGALNEDYDDYEDEFGGALTEAQKKLHRKYCCRRWNDIRDSMLASHPYCHWCTIQGKRTKATQIDHKQPLSSGGEPYARSNLVTSCTSCNTSRGAIHRHKTAGHKMTTLAK